MNALPRAIAAGRRAGASVVTGLSAVPVFSTFTSGLCAVGMFFVYNKRNNLIVNAVFSSVISCGNAALDCLITEIFPTHLR